MNYSIIKELPSADEIIQSIPLSAAGYQQILVDRQEIKNILTGMDSRLLMILGPCSAWPQAAVLNYAEKLARLNETVKTQLKIVMRVYIQKPRTSKGWTGPMNQPDPFASPDIAQGIRYARAMMVKVVETGLAIADEALFMHNTRGFLELLSWAAIGARSTENQGHRIFASAMDCAVGMKNPTHGNLKVAMNGILAAQTSHVAAFDGYEVQTHGNPYAHLVLRGNYLGPNYSPVHLREAESLMNIQGIKNPAIIVDASHDNCLVNGKKDYQLQPQVIHEVMLSRRHHAEIKNLVKGFMLESFLQPGRQVVDLSRPEAINLQGLSITDSCLGWQQTENLLLDLAHQVAAYG